MSINYIQFHIGDFLSGVMHMDGAEIGAYTMMIMAHYQTQYKGLPDDDKKLMRITRTNPKVWKRIKDTVLEKFYLEDGFWKHERVISEIDKIKAKSGTGRPRNNEQDSESEPTKVDVGNPKVDLEKPLLGTQVENKSLKINDSQKTNQEPITNNQYPPYIPPIGGDGVSTSLNGFGGYRIQDKIDDNAWHDARSHAQGWDVHFLCEVYNEGVNAMKREPPRYPNKAFPIWCKAYTKGKVP